MPEAARPLPEFVRSVVVALAADAIGRLAPDQLPAPLRKVASFAPPRRAKLGGAHILAALESDERFRERVATQSRALNPELAARAESPGPVDTTEVRTAREVAAMAYLMRSPEWELRVKEAEAVREPGDREARPGDEQRRRLADQLEDARTATRRLREELRGRTEDLKAENASLRRTVGQTRAQLAAAMRAVEHATREATDAKAGAVRAAEAAQSDVRRLRSRIEELEAETAHGRRAARGARDAENTRLRLLLDTIIDASQGLRRELALPPTTGALPADVVTSSDETPVTLSSRALTDVGAVLRVLELPRAHLIVDGYNVTKTAWGSSALDVQRARLLSAVGVVAARTRAEVTVIFDGAELATRPTVSAPRGVRVRFSPAGVTADALIGDIVSAEPPGRVLLVVSSDQEVARAAAREGARTTSSDVFVSVFSRS